MGKPRSIINPGDKGEIEAGTVKWFNSDKGMGFIAPVDGGKDVFVHNTEVCKTPGLTGLREEDGVEFCRFMQGDGRIGATDIVVIASKSGELEVVLGTQLISGTVKWFNPSKGFGFITLQGGGRDVFLHVSALEKAGVGAVTEGVELTFRLAERRDGRISASGLVLN